MPVLLGRLLFLCGCSLRTLAITFAVGAFVYLHPGRCFHLQSAVQQRRHVSTPLGPPSPPCSRTETRLSYTIATVRQREARERSSQAVGHDRITTWQCSDLNFPHARTAQPILVAQRSSASGGDICLRLVTWPNKNRSSRRGAATKCSLSPKDQKWSHGSCYSCPLFHRPAAAMHTDLVMLCTKESASASLSEIIAELYRYFDLKSTLTGSILL